MPYVVLDTNIVLAYARGTDRVIDVFEATFPPDEYEYVISIVTRAEMYALAACRGWTERTVEKVKELLDSYLQVRIDNEAIVNAYSIIDEFGRKSPNPLRSTTARHMGKNDLWIAATATLYNASLATLDGDFDHLESHFFMLNKFVLA
jgi:tRNA(fMet)-specific endonuclease VapC